MRKLLIAVAVALPLAATAHAQTYPTRAITMNVPFAAGGPTDTIARIIAQRMSAPLGQNIIIENVTGADGSIGVGRVARAAGETAPLLFTAAAAHATSLNLGGFMNSLPVQIYSDVTSPTEAVVERAWGAALTLVLLILILNMVARLLSRRNRLA